jgi:hypothetical protein
LLDSSVDTCRKCPRTVAVVWNERRRKIKRSTSIWFAPRQDRADPSKPGADRKPATSPRNPSSQTLAGLTERYSNVAIGKILDISEAAVRRMLKRAGIRRANRVFSSLDDWQAAIIRAELKAELARKDKTSRT